jgi:hypothetical protein
MNLRHLIPTDVTASAMAHLSLLALVLWLSDVHPFGAVTADSVAVDIVTPQEIAEKQMAELTPEPTPTPTPQPDFSLLEKPAAASAPAPASQPPAPARPQKQAASAAKPPAQPVVQQQAASPPPAQSAPPVPAYTPPEPDLTIKYHVLLGLPQDLPSARPPAPSSAKAADDFDAPAVESADIASSLVTEFRRRLRACSKLPAELKAADDVKVKLRVFMTQDGKLATEPVLIEASASMKGPLLMQAAIRALQACQPYAMLPPDRYGEWKVLDLSFTPRDFAS